jgi:hypothetical protein
MDYKNKYLKYKYLKYKYLKYKMKYLELKQKGGADPEKQAFISQISRHPDLPFPFIRYVFNQLKNINQYIRGKPPGFDNMVDMYRKIRAGGSGSFTNKIDSDGFIRLSDRQLEELYANVILFYQFANIINKPIKGLLESDYHIRVYRSIKFQAGEPPKSINQPIPFSCSWDIDFPVLEWGGRSGSKKVFEIIINNKTDFLPTSYPGDIRSLPDNFLINNQQQLEVVLPPGELKFIDKRIQKFVGKVDGKMFLVSIYTYGLHLYTEDEVYDKIIELLPEEPSPMEM